MLKNSLLFGILLVVLIGCKSSEDYDPDLQLVKDLAEIDQYIIDQGLNAEIDDSGVRYIINTIGNRRFPKSSNLVSVNYELTLLDGTFIDTNSEQIARLKNVYNSQRTYAPFEFRINGGRVIQGFNIGAQLLSEGGDGTFLIPSVLGYRNVGSSSVPPNANLIFKIELIEIN